MNYVNRGRRNFKKVWQTSTPFKHIFLRSFTQRVDKIEAPGTKLHSVRLSLSMMKPLLHYNIHHGPYHLKKMISKNIFKEKITFFLERDFIEFDLVPGLMKVI